MPELIRSASLGKTTVAIHVSDLTERQTLVSIQPDRLMIPASNMKLVTSFAALDLLGPEFSFRTSLDLIEPVEDASAEQGGDEAAPLLPLDPQDLTLKRALPSLVIRGDGDPALADPKLLEAAGLDVEAFLEAWVDHVAATGAQRFEALLIDDRVFDDQWVHPDWPENQLHRWYCAQVSGLSFYNNCLELWVAPTSPGKPPRVMLRPSAPFVDVVMRAVTGNTDRFGVGRTMGENELVLRGQIKHRRSEPVEVTVHDPAMFFARLLTDRLKARDIAVGQIRRVEHTETLPPSRPLLTVNTPLPAVLNRCNKASQNLFAEGLVKRMGYALTGEPGSWSNGANAVRRVLVKRLGTGAAIASIADGSGMSRENQVTARLIVQLLANMHTDPDLGLIFRESLSVAGQDGTLFRKRRLEDIEAKIYGKTGYINQVSTISGYMHYPARQPGQDDRMLAFSMLFNDIKPPIYPHQVMQVQDQLIKHIDQWVMTQLQRQQAEVGSDPR